MKKFTAVQHTFITMGVLPDNIDYAISAIKDGTRRELILESLTADYRGMNPVDAGLLLEALYRANGGEFKKENQGGYLYGALFLLIGLTGAAYLIYGWIYGGTLFKPILIGAASFSCLVIAASFIIKSITGKFREEDAGFLEE